MSDTEALEAVGEEALSEATAAAIAGLGPESAGALQAQLAFVGRMEEIADRHRNLPDARVQRLLAWIGENMCRACRPADRTASRHGMVGDS